MLLACIGQCGCFTFGTKQFYGDQLGYSQAVGDAEKAGTLLNVVRLRYADSPVVLQATQVIAGYQLQRNVTGGFEAFPAANPSTFLSGGASAQLQQSPTFTFQPLSGAQYARSFIRPLSPADLLPLTMGGLPIDVLFRLAVQSINGLSNAVLLAQVGAPGSPDFFLLLRDLRRLQIAGALSVRFHRETSGKSEGGQVYLSFGPTRDPELLATFGETKRLLALPPDATEAQVVYGVTPGHGEVAIISRSILGVLASLSLQVDVPPEDVARNLTHPTVGNIGLEHRPVVIIHSGPAAPAEAFTSVQYHHTWFWIAEDDFDSKVAFTVLQILLALGRTEIAPGAVVTIPAR
jgi:hypothetical protein